MTHDFSLVFDIDNPLWQRVLDIFAKNERYDKKVVKNRNLHHKFPRSFSKVLGEEVDNDKDNLISLSLADHFLVHYYYYLLAKKGYRQSMALAFRMMARKGMKYITPETAEAMAKDYEDAVEISRQIFQSDEFKAKLSAANKGKHLSDETCAKMSKSRQGLLKGRTYSDETRQKMSDAKKGKPSKLKGRKLSEEHRTHISESLKGKCIGSDNAFFGHTHTEETKRKIAERAKARIFSEETKRKQSEAIKEWWAKRKQGT